MCGRAKALILHLRGRIGRLSVVHYWSAVWPQLVFTQPQVANTTATWMAGFRNRSVNDTLLNDRVWTPLPPIRFGGNGSRPACRFAARLITARWRSPDSLRDIDLPVFPTTVVLIQRQFMLLLGAIPPIITVTMQNIDQAVPPPEQRSRCRR